MPVGWLKLAASPLPSANAGAPDPARTRDPPALSKTHTQLLSMSDEKTSPDGASTATPRARTGCEAYCVGRNVVVCPGAYCLMALLTPRKRDLLASSKTPQPAAQDPYAAPLAKKAVDHTPAPASTAVPSGQRPGQEQSVGGAAPPLHADPDGHGTPLDAVLPAPHAKPGAAAHGAVQDESLRPGAAP